jgi:hypothetical protein
VTPDERQLPGATETFRTAQGRSGIHAQSRCTQRDLERPLNV